MKNIFTNSLAQRHYRVSFLILPVVAIFSYYIIYPPLAYTLETSPAAINIGSNEFGLDTDSNSHQQERKEVEQFLAQIEKAWNEHNLESVMSNYADDYVNNDGLDKKAVSELTKDFWKTYPDAKSASKTKEIRIDGNFATVESRDTAVGSTAKEMPGVGTKGDLSSVSEGQLYLKKTGNVWRIIGDRIDYEKVRVAFGLARDLEASFSAPEQVKSGKQYSAKLEVSLPSGLSAVGSITNQPLEYPQPQPTDSWRPLDGSALERVMGANSANRNELLMATVGITNAARNSLMGIAFLTRRLNVVANPSDSEVSDKSSEKTAVAEDRKSSIKDSLKKIEEKPAEE